MCSYVCMLIHVFMCSYIHRFGRRRKVLRINYKTCRQIWGLNGVGRNEHAHPCSSMGQAFYIWRATASRSMYVRGKATIIGHSINGKHLLRKYMSHWEEIHGFSSCKYQIMNRRFADWVYFKHLRSQGKLSNEIVCIGKRHLDSVKIKHSLRKWLFLTRQNALQDLNDFRMRRDNFLLAAKVANESYKIRIFRIKMIFVAWTGINAERRCEMRRILLQNRIQLIFHRWKHACYNHYIKHALKSAHAPTSPVASLAVHYSRLSSISSKFHRQTLAEHVEQELSICNSPEIKCPWPLYPSLRRRLP